MISFKSQLKRFIITGISTVLIDLLIYFLLLKLGVFISVSKGISFSIGTLYSYNINKNWTFKKKGRNKTFVKYICIYVMSLLLNTSINRFLIYFSSIKSIILLAFLFSTLISAIFNFILLKHYVFRKV